jgi:hypothetical protein
MTSLIEKGDKESSVDPVTLKERALAAREHYRNLPVEVRRPLSKAVLASPLVRRTLEQGNWLSLVRALRGLSARTGDTSYAELAVTMERSTPNLLEH